LAYFSNHVEDAKIMALISQTLQFIWVMYIMKVIHQMDLLK